MRFLARCALVLLAAACLPFFGCAAPAAPEAEGEIDAPIARYNEENEIHLSAAWGHAFFNPETDHGLSEIVKRADGMLYAMKRAMKQAAENAS